MPVFDRTCPVTVHPSKGRSRGTRRSLAEQSGPAIDYTSSQSPTSLSSFTHQSLYFMPPPRFWEFAHLTSEYRNMGWVDQVPRAGKLFIGGLHALYQKPDLFAQAEITHILSVLDFDIYEAGHFSKYKHLMLRVDDDPNENLLRHFKESNAFIHSSLEQGGGVFVHCAMGKSRSATIVCAYLMWKDSMTPGDALKQVCEGRPICSPNPGFMEQLGVYHEMLKVRDEGKAEEVYQRWLKQRFRGDWWTWDKRARGTKL
jgi:dual specificity phosphatase 12